MMGRAGQNNGKANQGSEAVSENEIAELFYHSAIDFVRASTNTAISEHTPPAALFDVLLNS